MFARITYLSVLNALLLGKTSSADVEEACNEKFRLLCREQQYCGDCMLAHSCCSWCYDETNFTGRYRCDFSDALSECGQNIEFNHRSSLKAVQNLNFTVINSAEEATSAIQIKPQLFNVVLRKDTPINLTFTYKSAKDYPLELYYLGDLSYSMKTHLETLKNLGDALGNKLENLTKHYRLAFGSFLDKPGMPFIWMDNKNYENPCNPVDGQCDKTYLFKHSLNFTSDTGKFFEQVKNSKISANVDDLDGALEAIYQVLVCDKQFGWSDYSRKIILLSTDSLLHTEGDGLLVGASKVNVEEKCLVDSNGDHTDPLTYDYPSLGQIKSLLRKQKVNLIVAVTQDKIKPYLKMKKDVLNRESYIGVLQNNSANILDLVANGFYDFIRQVDFSANLSHAPELQVKFYGDCDRGGYFNETSGCQAVQVEKEINFIVELTLKESTEKFSERISIKEQSIEEQIDIKMTYISGTCECPKYRRAREITCEHGRIDCGACVCDKGWKGDTCSVECSDDLKLCRIDDDALQICTGRGDCLCGQCSCQKPYTGQFCQFECPVDRTNKICSGRGKCREGVCECEPGYIKSDCSCEDKVDGCRLKTDDRLCNGQGTCECNRCTCDQYYSGAYCEVKDHISQFCDSYEDDVVEYNLRNGSGKLTHDDSVVLFENWDQNDVCRDQVTCSALYFVSATTRCVVNYCYGQENNSVVQLQMFKKKCTYTDEAKGITMAIGVFCGIIVFGLIMILLRKYRIYKLDQAEFKKFTATPHGFNQINPIYKSPLSHYNNPLNKNK